jgi:murein tripeptide amidase MpaA
MRPKTHTSITFILMLLILLSSTAPLAAQRKSATRNNRQRAATASENAPAPESVLGFRPGDDRKLASWQSIVDYFNRLDAASDRVKFEELGKTTMGRPFVMATISAPENLARLNEYRRIQEQLADPRLPASNTERKAAQLIARGKTIVLITCGIHSTEVGSTLSSMLIAHRLASSDDAQVQKILRETIVLLVPSLNPDGVDIVKNWYDKTLGTPYEGTDPPELYHKYTGHDNNRDWYAFTQVETQLTVDKIHNVWHPQIVHDIHQQQSNGARIFLPPYMEPVEPNVPKQIVEGYTELGQAMAAEMRASGFKGITTGTSYDAWTPARAYSHYHGGVRILSETASARIATPITIKLEEMRGSVGYDAKKESDKFKPLWPGGEWHLRDITNYMTAAAFALMTHAAENRERWLKRFYELGKEAVRLRTQGELWGFKIKVSENTPELIDILERAGVEIGYLAGEKPIEVTNLSAAKITYPTRTLVIPLGQPYGAFAKALLEKQDYPNLRDANNQPIAPYDVTSHTLSLLMEVEVSPIIAPFNGRYLKRPHINTAISDCPTTGRKEIAIYKSHVPSMDEGWTRWVFRRTCIEYEYEAITDQEIRRKNFEQKHRNQSLKELRYNYIVIPDQSPRALLEGHRKGSMPEEYTGGLGPEGVKALREFVEAGGTLVFLNRASNFAVEQFKLPLRDITQGLRRTEFYAPGSILRIELDATHPIAAGMPQESVAWVENSPVFEVTDAKDAEARVRVIARYPAASDPLLSGWLLGGERMRGRAALVEVTMGKGRVILFGFRPQYRAQSLATYPLLFNALRK